MNSHLANYGTFSKSPAMWGLPDNLAILSAHGCRASLNDGNSYIDLVSGLGAILFGYSHPAIVRHLAVALYEGAGSLSLPSVLEGETAELLVEKVGRHVPGWATEPLSVRFAKTGSGAVTMAVRLARAITNRQWIITFKGHYHGWHDWTVARTPPARGITVFAEQVYEAETLADVQSWLAMMPAAAVIFEHKLDEPEPEFYEQLRQICTEAGALLIADEVVTGLRYAPGGICQYYGIKPDLVCLGKGLGNGLPIAAVLGPDKWLKEFRGDQPVFCSSTMWGETMGLAAAKAVLLNYDETVVEHIHRLGQRLLAESPWPVSGHAPRSLFTFCSEFERGYFIKAMFKRGWLVNRPNFLSLSHDERIITNLLETLAEVRQEINDLDMETMADEAKPLPRVLFRGR